MKIWTIGEDARMKGLIRAAEQAKDTVVRIKAPKEAEEQAGERPDAVVMPWPVSAEGGRIIGAEQMTAEAAITLCRCAEKRLPVLYGRGIDASRIGETVCRIDPSKDEPFLRENAELTAEGALCAVMERRIRALKGSCCVITGFGRIGRSLAVRLKAMDAFVIVCARSEAQMHDAHAMGVHPVPLPSMHAALKDADVLFNTVPCRIIGKAELEALPKRALLVELASAPFGFDAELAETMGLQVLREPGVPGRYAPEQAGRALYDAVVRAVRRKVAE